MSVLVKICGVRTEPCARACGDAGVDLVGLNLVPSSPRHVSTTQARILRPLLGMARTVGVFRNQPLAEVIGLATELQLDFVQLHGDESPEDCARVAAAGHAVIKAITPEILADVALLQAHAQAARYFLLDGTSPGSGQRLDWDALAPIAGGVAGKPVILAGGLDPANVGEAIRRLAPAGVDVASGIERDGQGDPGLIRLFCQRARAAATAAARSAP